MDDPNENNKLNESIVSSGKFLETSSSSEVANVFDDNRGVPLNFTKSLSKNESLYPVNLSWHGLSYVVKKKFKKEYVTILKNVTGETRAGELTALLGPSGAGKTTFLNILVGGLKNGVSGKVVVNGKERKESTFQSLICYTQQHDEVLSDLSLMETLTVAANLKLDRRITREEKCKIV